MLNDTNGLLYNASLQCIAKFQNTNKKYRIYKDKYACILFGVKILTNAQS